jgi:hypothetical protein
MLVGRTVAATDVPASHAHPQVEPAAAHAEAVLAPFAGGSDVRDRVEVRARLSHRPRSYVAGAHSGPGYHARVTVAGRAGELTDRLLDLLDEPGPQLRAVATTLLIKAVDVPTGEVELIEAMVASDDAAAMIDAPAAAAAGLKLRHRLAERLGELACEHGEATVVRAMRDHLTAQIDRWATRAVDDADSRRRAERLLAWADRPGQLEAAQRRGLFVGMDAVELRRLADRQARGPVSPETALGVWAEADAWRTQVDERLGDDVLAEWRAATGEA